MNVTNREARQWDKVHHQAAMRQIAKKRQEAVAAYLKQSNTPEGASGCSQAVVSHEGRGSCYARQPAEAFAGMNSARATVSTTAAAPEKNPGIVSPTPHAAVGAGLGSSQGCLF